MGDQGRLLVWTENVCRVGKVLGGIGGRIKGVSDGGGRMVQWDEIGVKVEEVKEEIEVEVELMVVEMGVVVVLMVKVMILMVEVLGMEEVL